MSPAQKPNPALPASGSSLNAEGRHTCRLCPACGTEECAVFEELGTYCATLCAASQSVARDAPREKKRSPVAA